MSTLKDYDVVVVGGGMAGTAAAVIASRNGAKTLLLEKGTCLGGLATLGLVMPMLGIFSESTQLAGGVFDDICKKMIASGYGKFESWMTEGLCFFYDPVYLTNVLDEIATEAGVDVLYSTLVMNANLDKGRLRSINIGSGCKTSEVLGNVFIDATGDANLVCMAGLPWKKGRESDGRTQALTLRFILQDVDLEEANHFLNNNEGRSIIEKEIKSHNKNNCIRLNEYGFQHFPVPGRKSAIVFNCPRLLGYDPTKVQDLTKAQIDGRQRVQIILKILKRASAAFKDASIASYANILGVRESRRIVGKYVIDGDDVISAKKFTDGVAANNWFIDIHNPNGIGILDRRELEPGKWHDIPYRSLQPLGVDNLLTAGRCISCTHEAQASVRIMPTCMSTGQAAGMAGTLAYDGIVGNVDTQLLRSKLASQGAKITGITLPSD